ncbi:MAG TPA: hypothetical protein PLE74_12010 [Candidatus Cloacimonadota bacterium]|nr:hypothetical protein [Candidatus Cloacimonadota bacterium]
MKVIHEAYKKGIFIILFMMLTFSIFSAVVTHPYSYLPKPPISAVVSAIPDRETYNRNELISFTVVVTLDTLQAQQDRQYKLVIGSLGDILVSSQLIKSDVKNTYDMDFKNNVVTMKFTVQMLQDDTPPNIKLEAIRIANEDSAVKKQYHSSVIDQYEAMLITSPKYHEAQKSGR